MLITLEGIDGAGKTTLSQALAARLISEGRSVLALREPGGVVVSERIRGLVADPDLPVGPRAEALLFAAARAQLVDEAVRPALEAGTWVLLDRFVDSSLAYQGGARGLGVVAIAEINAFATGGLRPDLTLLLRLDPATGAARRGGGDRIEQEDSAFFVAVAAAYDALAAAEPDRVVVIDATLAPAAVLEAALAAVHSA